MNLVRCSAWSVCGSKECFLSEARFKLTKKSKPAYCEWIRRFVVDRPAPEINTGMDCDPNLAFRVHRGENVFGEK
jgi:hypothetical protein